MTPSSEAVERTEVLQQEPAQALGALLDVAVPDLGNDGLPLLWHWLYLMERPAQANLGPDGHPARATVPAPPAPGRRRMWAGGRVWSRGRLRCGEPATKHTEVRSVREKHGRSGALTFVVVGHQIVQGGKIVVEEEQDIVYKPSATNRERIDHGLPVPVIEGEWPICVSPTLLFRFSALTYNAHRIHYDRDYAREVEGYPGLLVHGPLQALTMAEAARARKGSGDFFDYRLVAPLFDYQGMVVNAVGGLETVTAVRDLYGRQTATGTLRRLAHES